MKIAYLCEPQLGGTYTFFKTLRPLLLERGMELTCVSEASDEWFRQSRFARDEGVLCASIDQAAPLKEQTRQMLALLQAHAFDAILVLPGCSLLSSNLPGYLPRNMKCVMRVPMMTRGAYAPTAAVQPHVNRILAVSDRIRFDLVRHFHVPEDKIRVIYHGVPTSGSFPRKDVPSSSEPLRLLYAGRLTDLDKGVFLLPKIMRGVKNSEANVHLYVAGGGEDEQELKHRFEALGLSDSVTFLGRKRTEEMAAVFSAADAFLLPSRFEGCGFALLEAMAAGCAPIASDIMGSLRVILGDGQFGKLARVGDAKAFAQHIVALAKDREALRAAQQTAFQRVQSEYSLQKMGDAYAKTFQEVFSSQDSRAPQLSLEQYAISNALKPTWRTLIPKPLKNFIRTWMERFSLST